MDSPSPVPPLARLVVKKGSKICLRVRSLIPLPSSATVMTTSPSSWRVATVMVPRRPSGMAWLALMIRLMSTCSSFWALPVKGGSSEARSSSMSANLWTWLWTRRALSSMTVLTSTLSMSSPSSLRAKRLRASTMRLMRSEPLAMSLMSVPM